MPDLIPFTFAANEIRIITQDDGSLWWVLTDVCKALGILNPSDVARRLESKNCSTLDSTYTGNPAGLLIVNEAGLYRVIFRSDKPAARDFQAWVFEDVIPQIRKTGKYEPVKSPSRLEDLDFAERCAGFLQRIGAFEERDKLMIADKVRTLLLTEPGAPKGLPSPQGFFLSERIQALGYRLTRTQEAQLMSRGLARQVANEYRKRYGQDPLQSQRFVDGAVRPVFWYPHTEAEWMDTMIQARCAKLGVALPVKTD